MNIRLWIYVEYGLTPSLPLLPGLVWFRVIVPVWVPSMCQINLFENYLYLIWTLNSIYCKSFILRIGTFSYNYLQRIIISYLKRSIFLSVELRIRWLYPLQRGKVPPKQGVLGIRLNCIVVRFPFWSSADCGQPHHCHYSGGSLCSGLVVLETSLWVKSVLKYSY